MAVNPMLAVTRASTSPQKNAREAWMWFVLRVCKPLLTQGIRNMTIRWE